MKKLLFYLFIILVISACSNSSSEKTKIVDTTITGSDNPNPPVDTAKGDSLK